MSVSCCVKGCKITEFEVIYYNKGICFKHWEQHCNPNSRTDLKKLFKIPDEPTKVLKSLIIEGL